MEKLLIIYELICSQNIPYFLKSEIRMILKREHEGAPQLWDQVTEETK